MLYHPGLLCVPLNKKRRRSKTKALFIFLPSPVLGKPLDDRRLGNRPCPPLENIDAFFEEALIHARGRARGAAAPLACVQAVRGAATLPFLKGMELEKRLMETLMTSGQAQASRYCFFTERGAARWTTPTGARWDTCRARPISTAAVIGIYASCI